MNTTAFVTYHMSSYLLLFSCLFIEIKNKIKKVLRGIDRIVDLEVTARDMSEQLGRGNNNSNNKPSPPRGQPKPYPGAPPPPFPWGSAPPSAGTAPTPPSRPLPPSSPQKQQQGNHDKNAGASVSAAGATLSSTLSSACSRDEGRATVDGKELGLEVRSELASEKKSSEPFSDHKPKFYSEDKPSIFSEDNFPEPLSGDSSECSLEDKISGTYSEDKSEHFSEEKSSEPFLINGVGGKAARTGSLLVDGKVRGGTGSEMGEEELVEIGPTALRDEQGVRKQLRSFGGGGCDA